MSVGKELREKEAGGILNGLFSEPSSPPSTNPFGSSTPLTYSVAKIVEEAKRLKKEETELSKYKEVQHLQLVKLQNKILDAVTEEKLESASLPELVRSFAMLKEKEHLMTGKATQINGIVGYLLQLEKEEQEGKVLVLNPASSADEEASFELGPVEETDFHEDVEEEQLPNL